MKKSERRRKEEEEEEEESELGLARSLVRSLTSDVGKTVFWHAFPPSLPLSLGSNEYEWYLSVRRGQRTLEPDSLTVRSTAPKCKLTSKSN